MNNIILDFVTEHNHNMTMKINNVKDDITVEDVKKITKTFIDKKFINDEKKGVLKELVGARLEKTNTDLFDVNEDKKVEEAEEPEENVDRGEDGLGDN